MFAHGMHQDADCNEHMIAAYVLDDYEKALFETVLALPKETLDNILNSAGVFSLVRNGDSWHTNFANNAY
jgi:hypothetical protein